jgi:hypothetical protein
MSEHPGIKLLKSNTLFAELKRAEYTVDSKLKSLNLINKRLRNTFEFYKDLQERASKPAASKGGRRKSPKDKSRKDKSRKDKGRKTRGRKDKGRKDKGRKTRRH